MRAVGIEEMKEDGKVKFMAHEKAFSNDIDVVFEADYVVGADGANSSIRRILCIVCCNHPTPFSPSQPAG